MRQLYFSVFYRRRLSVVLVASPLLSPATTQRGFSLFLRVFSWIQFFWATANNQSNQGHLRLPPAGLPRLSITRTTAVLLHNFTSSFRAHFHYHNTIITAAPHPPNRFRRLVLAHAHSRLGYNTTRRSLAGLQISNWALKHTGAHRLRHLAFLPY